MLPICRPVTFVPPIQLVCTLHRSRFSQLVPAAFGQKAMLRELSSKSLLDDQAFGGDLLNRSVGDRRDEKFVKTSFEGSSSLLISGRTVMAKQASGSNSSRQHTALCWLSPQDFAEYGIEPQTDSQTTVTGKSCVCSVPASHFWQNACQPAAYIHHENVYRSRSRSFGSIPTWTHKARHMVICHGCISIQQPGAAS